MFMKHVLVGLCAVEPIHMPNGSKEQRRCVQFWNEWAEKMVELAVQLLAVCNGELGQPPDGTKSIRFPASVGHIHNKIQSFSTSRTGFDSDVHGMSRALNVFQMKTCASMAHCFFFNFTVS